MKTLRSPYSSSVRGFSLVEIMVAMLIGMFGIIIMMQVFALFEGNKRTTTSGGDAQNNGAIALYGVQRDVRSAGYGLSAYNLLGCSLTRGGIVLTNSLSPMTINPPNIPAGDANTDTLLVIAGNSNNSTEGDTIVTQTSNTDLFMQAGVSFTVGDRVIALPKTRPAPCNMVLDTVNAIAAPTVTVATGAAGLATGSLIDLGPTPQVIAYAIRGGNLTLCDFMVNDCSAAASVNDTTIWVPIASNIVSLRAQYGKDASAPMVGILDSYDQVTPSAAGGFTVNCAWVRVPAVRMALLARSTQYEKPDPTTNAPVTPNVLTWAGSASATPIAFDLSANAGWQNYRYNVLETTIPLRNMIWLGVQTGC